MLLAMTERANPKPPQPSPLGLIVLWQLWSEPMHVYRLQKLLEAEGKDRIVNVRSRASLYQAIERLERLGLVEVSATVRQDGYPDRVVYAITESGRLVARQWLREMLSDTGGQYPEFIAALSNTNKVVWRSTARAEDKDFTKPKEVEKAVGKALEKFPASRAALLSEARRASITGRDGAGSRA